MRYPAAQPVTGTTLKIIANAVVARLQIDQTAIDALRPPPVELRNPDKRQQSALKASIQEFGILKPILVDPNNVIIAGYAVWKAANATGLKDVPAISIAHLTPEQIRLYRLADNQIATFSSFDEEMLRIEIGELSGLSLDLGLELNLELTGFSTAEIDNVLLNAKAEPDAEPKEADQEAATAEAVVSRLGDLWNAGDHRIICGNSLEEPSYSALMRGELAQMVPQATQDGSVQERSATTTARTEAGGSARPCSSHSREAGRNNQLQG